MNTQQSFVQALETLNVLALAYQSPYWTGLINTAKGLTLKTAAKGGAVQATISNPLAYFVVPLAGDGKNGRTDQFTIDQFEFALKEGYESGADVEFRSGKNEKVINAGLCYTKGKKASARLGSLESREYAHKLSALAAKGAKVSNLAKELAEAETSGIFQEDWSASLAIEDLKRRLAAVKLPKVKATEMAKKGRK